MFKIRGRSTDCSNDLPTLLRNLEGPADVTDSLKELADDFENHEKAMIGQGGQTNTCGKELRKQRNKLIKSPADKPITTARQTPSSKTSGGTCYGVAGAAVIAIIPTPAGIMVEKFTGDEEQESLSTINQIGDSGNFFADSGSGEVIEDSVGSFETTLASVGFTAAMVGPGAVDCANDVSKVRYLRYVPRPKAGKVISDGIDKAVREGIEVFNKNVNTVMKPAKSLFEHAVDDLGERGAKVLSKHAAVTGTGLEVANLALLPLDASEAGIFIADLVKEHQKTSQEKACTKNYVELMEQYTMCTAFFCSDIADEIFDKETTAGCWSGYYHCMGDAKNAENKQSKQNECGEKY